MKTIKGNLTLTKNKKYNEDLYVEANIHAHDIDALDIHAHDITANKIDVKGDITAHDITANNIDAWNIIAWDINATGNINAGDINTRNIDANKISYYAVCFAYKNIKCKSIKGERYNACHFVLDGKLTVNGKEVKNKV